MVVKYFPKIQIFERYKTKQKHIPILNEYVQLKVLNFSIHDYYILYTIDGTNKNRVV